LAGTINATIGLGFNLLSSGDLSEKDIWGDLGKDFLIGAAFAPVGGGLVKAFAPVLKGFARSFLPLIGNLSRITLVGKSASEKLITRISRFFLNTNVSYPRVGSTLIGKLLKLSFPKVQWEMHHVWIQQAWSRVGSSQQIYGNLLANQGLKRIANGLWNLLPIPRGLNNYLGSRPYATELFATAYYSMITFGASQTFGEIFLD
jgi:hypothetical protein